MRTFIVAVFGLLAGLGLPSLAAAQGCGPTRLKVSAAVTLDRTPEEAWRLVGNFQDMSWARNTRLTTGTGGNAPDTAVRRVTLADGTVLEDSLYKYADGAMTYAWHVDKVDLGVLPVQNASVTLEVVPFDEASKARGVAKSTVRLRAAFYRYLAPGETAPDAADAKAAKSVDILLHQILEGLNAKAEART